MGVVLFIVAMLSYVLGQMAGRKWYSVLFFAGGWLLGSLLIWLGGKIK